MQVTVCILFVLQIHDKQTPYLENTVFEVSVYLAHTDIPLLSC